MMKKGLNCSMVFFTSILIVIILYYLQTEGLIFVTLVAVVGEMINLFLTQTAAKASEKKTAVKFSKTIQGYKTKIESQKKAIKELEEIQEESIRKIMTANQKIAAYEEKYGVLPDQENISKKADDKNSDKKQAGGDTPKKTEGFSDLPPGSNRKPLPI
jgi:uncharacterized membrane protein